MVVLEAGPFFPVLQLKHPFDIVHVCDGAQILILGIFFCQVEEVLDEVELFGCHVDHFLFIFELVEYLLHFFKQLDLQTYIVFPQLNHSFAVSDQYFPESSLSVDVVGQLHEDVLVCFVSLDTFFAEFVQILDDLFEYFLLLNKILFLGELSPFFGCDFIAIVFEDLFDAADHVVIDVPIEFLIVHPYTFSQLDQLFRANFEVLLHVEILICAAEVFFFGCFGQLEYSLIELFVYFGVVFEVVDESFLQVGFVGGLLFEFADHVSDDEFVAGGDLLVLTVESSEVLEDGTDTLFLSLSQHY